MKQELKKYSLGFGLGSALVLSLSSCSLVGKGKYASQWEIQTDVPASLSSGRASTPAPDALAGTMPPSNLDGIAPVPDVALDLPVSENGGMIEIPKPAGAPGTLAYQSPPEMLNIPGAESPGDLPYQTVGQQELNTFLAPPPPPVTEEELALAPAAVAAAEAADPATEVPPVPAAPPDAEAPAVPTPAPSIPLLYGKLDLAPFLNPPTPLAVNAEPPTAAP
jgi:hypothetical protein